jgi:hypothetical protein
MVQTLSLPFDGGRPEPDVVVVDLIEHVFGKVV